MNLLIKEKYYRGFWIVLKRTDIGVRWDIENRAGIVTLKGERECDSQAACILDAEIAIDLMVDQAAFVNSVW